MGVGGLGLRVGGFLWGKRVLWGTCMRRGRMLLPRGTGPAHTADFLINPGVDNS